MSPTTTVEKTSAAVFCLGFTVLLGLVRTADAHHSGSFRSGFMRAIPFQDTKLWCLGTPVVLQTSLLGCAVQCLDSPSCQSFNFGNDSCELMTSYLCDSLGECLMMYASGTKHYDVELGSDVYSGQDPMETEDCQTLGRCSFKCSSLTESTPPPSNLTCNENLALSSGSLASPNFGTGNYPPSTFYVWCITAPESNYVIRLTFLTFALEGISTCGFDFVEVYDANNNDAASRIGQFCGETVPGPVTSSQRYMTVTFTSDDNLQKAGFSAQYQTLDPSFEVIGSQCSEDSTCQLHLADTKCSANAQCRCHMGFATYTSPGGRVECAADCRPMSNYTDLFESDPGFGVATAYVTLTRNNVADTLSCLFHCVNENDFLCRSVSYDTTQQVCLLSSHGCADSADVCQASYSATLFTRNCV